MIDPEDYQSYDFCVQDEEDENEQYFDVPIQYRPLSLTKRKMPMKEETTHVPQTNDETQSTISIVAETQKLCQMLMKTPHYQKMGAEGIFAIVQKAKAIGVDPLDALNGGFYFVQGKVELTSTMMNDLIRRRGHSITKDKRSDDKICILHGRRADNGDTWSESFSIEDAKLAQIYRNQWLKYPKDMLFARALSRLARQLFPDVIKGCYVEGEIRQAKGLDNGNESPLEALEAIVKTPGDDIEQFKDLIEAHIPLENPEFLIRYLEFVDKVSNKSLKTVVESWLENPAPFLAHYKKWTDNKKLEKNPKSTYQEEEDLFQVAEQG